MWETFKASTDYENRVTAVNAYNNSNKWTKKGISMTTVKFGIGWEGGQVCFYIINYYFIFTFIFIYFIFLLLFIFILK